MITIEHIKSFELVLARDYEGAHSLLPIEFAAAGMPPKYADLTDEQKIKHYLTWPQHAREMQTFGESIRNGSAP